MAWITKPSATTQIARRKDPYLTPAMMEKYRAEILPRYEKSMGALMPILHEVQHEYGYIPHQAMVEIAEFLKITPADVLDTVSFYEEYRTEPPGRNIIGVCQSIACEFCGVGHTKILDHLRRKLNIEEHETTDDGKFTLLTMECLGACDFGPVALVNDELHTNLTPQKIDQIIDSLPE
ncbi:MAG: NADH-quinone oxidoreductase subunit NuoE [Phycisphaerales bacterium]|nr:NADH-quinone oxidoreductase subunit NuoE [Phycisphaerales bacterium]MCI0630576.1 NADH-quinone oxidoreductase subunit NuoE [Phycisphaerales bacterium]MCI0676038.1 NADH-quinone oxidoreductase subunit NuoE [Phycisphaerales bacterium]